MDSSLSFSYSSTSILFMLCTVLSLGLFYWAMKRSENKHTHYVTAGLIVWLIIQAVLSLNHVYSSDSTSMPPKIFLFGILPNIGAMLLAFFTKAGRRLIDSLNLKKLTWLHIVRIPVEIGLYLLFLDKLIPEIMTFAGWNFDILAGLTAPIIVYLRWSIARLSDTGLLLWNLIALAMVLFIFITGTLSAPSPFQQLGLEQPNVGLLYFPFSWLPTFIVPLVVFTHLASIRLILKGRPVD